MTVVSTVPRRTNADLVHSTAKALLGTIPLVGAMATELFVTLVTSPLEKRRDEWMEEMGSVLAEAHKAGQLDLLSVARDQRFVDTLLQASGAAIKTSDSDKRRALRNAVLNSGGSNPPAEAVQHVFIRLVDEFTAWHLKLLALFEQPKQWFQEDHPARYSWNFRGTLAGIVESSYTELEGKRPLYDQFWRDLYLRGMVETDTLHTLLPAEVLTRGHVTPLGNDFLAFIREPSVLCSAE